MKILKSTGVIQLIEVNKDVYEIRENDKVILKLEGTFTDEQLEEQFNNVGESYVII